MKPLCLPSILLMVGLMVGPVAACKTAPETPVSEDDPAEGTTVSGTPGPFEVAETWLESTSGADDAVLALVEQWPDAPQVERMRRSGDAYNALLTSGDSPDAVLLTLRPAGSGWEVVESEIVPSDWGWPVR